MRAFIYLFLLLFFLSSCSDNDGDKYTGVWEIDKYSIVVIKSAGDKGYFLSFKYGGDRYDYSRFCEFKDGCFMDLEAKEISAILCVNGQNLIKQNGEIYTKKLKTKKK